MARPDRAARLLLAAMAALGLAACQASAPVAPGPRLVAAAAVFQVGRAESRVMSVVGPAPEAAPTPSPAPQAMPTPAPNGDGAAPAAATPPPRRSRGGGGSGGGRSGGGAPPATPAPTATPIPLANTLDAGPGILAGVVRDVRAAGAPVPDAAVTVVSAADVAKVAVVATAADGTWRVPGVALGEYRVSVRKAGWAAGPAPVEVVLYGAAPAALSVNFALAP